MDHKRTVHDHEPFEVANDRHAGGGGETRVAGYMGQTAANETCCSKNQAPLTSEGLRQWEMHAHVDHVFDLVPFWQRGIDAAEKGEVLRLEEFLEQMEGDGGWRTANDVLGVLGGWKMSTAERARDQGETGWGQREAWEPNGFGWGWGVNSACVASDATETSHGRDGGWGTRKEWAGRGKNGGGQDGRGVRGELRDFVDAIARQEAVTEDRRREMHMFLEVSCRSLSDGLGDVDRERWQMPVEQQIQKIHETIQTLRTRT